MFERFSQRARQAVVLAQEEALALGHAHIGTEHLLLALVHQGEGVAATVLRSFDVSLEEVRTEVEVMVPAGTSSPRGNVPFTPRTKKVLELSLREALQLGHNYIGTEHLLLGLLREGEGVGAQALVRLGLGLDLVRERVLELLSGNPRPAAPPRPAHLLEQVAEAQPFAAGALPLTPPSEPVCPSCRRPLAGNLRRSPVSVSPEREAAPPLEAIWCGMCGATLNLVPPV